MCLRKHFLYSVLVLLITGPLSVIAQVKQDAAIVVTDTTDLDVLFKKARDFGYAENNSQARKICQKILEKKPNYYDVRTFLGRTYAWDHQYDNARTELSRVLIERENDAEALSALIDVETWSHNFTVAGEYLKIALGYYPTSEDLLLKKANLQLKMEENENASITLRKILDLNPGNKEALATLNGLSKTKLNNRAQVGFYTDYFDKSLVPQRLITGEIGRSFNFGSLAIRGSYADKFGLRGTQYEAESYMRLSKGNYIYLNAGFSQSVLFPDYRGAFEDYQKIGSGFEVSAGYRYMQFSLPPTQIYTFNLSNYYRNYLFSLRAYFVPKTSIGPETFLQKSAQVYVLSIRNYFSDADNFLEMKISRGISPDERKLFTPVTSRLNAYGGGLSYQFQSFGRWIMKGELLYTRQEIRQDKFQQVINVGISLRNIF